MTDEQKLESVRRDIPFLAKGIYVDNASVSPIPTRVQKASERYNALLAEDLRNARPLSLAVFDKGRGLAARLVGSQPQNIAYIQNTSHGLSLVALGIEWRSGDNMIVCDQEFPSNYLCWLQLAEKGVEVRRVSSVDGTLTPDHIRNMIDSRTRVVSLSHVQFYSGFRVDVAACGELCSKHGALLIVDGTQSVGAVTVDVDASGIDVLAVSAHKWLMGPRGIGFATFSPRALDQIKPQIIGWLSVQDPFEFKRTLEFLPDARRFEPGTPNGAGIYGLTERLTQIEELGAGWIEDRILNLGELLHSHAVESGLTPVYEFDRRHRSGISLLRRSGASAAELHARLTENGIFASIRNDAVRVALHYYNTAGEIDRIVSFMRAS